MDKKPLLKIAFFVSQFPSVTETFIVNQIVEFKQQGHLVHIYAFHKNENIPIHPIISQSGLLDETFFLYHIEGNRYYKTRLLLKGLFTNFLKKNTWTVIQSSTKPTEDTSIFDSIQFLNKPCYDVIHAHFGINGNYVEKLRRLGLFKVSKFITTFHGYDLNERYGKEGLYVKLFRHCDLFTVNSNFSKKKLVKLGCRETLIEVVPVGLDTKFFKKRQVRADQSVIQLLFVGRLIQLKGPDIFIKICHLLKLKSLIKFQATIIGDGEMYNELQSSIKACALESIITLTKAVNQEAVMEFMDTADIFIFPGNEIEGNVDTQGLVIQEAQAMELPVLVSDAGGMQEGLIDTVTGFVIRGNDLNIYLEKIEQLARDVDLRKIMGAAGRAHVVKNYDIISLNERLLKLYSN